MKMVTSDLYQTSNVQYCIMSKVTPSQKQFDLSWSSYERKLYM